MASMEMMTCLITPFSKEELKDCFRIKRSKKILGENFLELTIT